MFKSVAIYVGLSVIVFLALAALLPPDQRSYLVYVAAVLLLAAIVMVLLTWRSSVLFIQGHPGQLKLLGWSMAVLGIVIAIGVPLAAIFMNVTLPVPQEAVMSGGTLFAIAGFMTAQLPKAVRQTEQAKALQAAPRPSPSSRSLSVGVKEGVDACSSVIRGWRLFLQIAGPFALIFGALIPWAVKLGDAFPKGADPTGLILILIGLVLALILVIPTVFVAWCRWRLEGRLPRLVALPDGASLSLLWRLWLFSSILGFGDALVTQKVTEVSESLHLATAPQIGFGAGWILDLFVVMAASSFALRFPAVAVRDSAFSRTAAVVQGRRMWPALPIGLVVSMAPFLIASIGAGRIDDVRGPKGAHTFGVGELVSFGLTTVGLLLAFAAVCSAASLLSIRYQMAKASETPWAET